MKPKIDMVGIITHKFSEMVRFYHEALGFKIKMQMDNFAEFESEGVRFAISTAEVMKNATGQASYAEETKGHSLELAFRVDTPEEVDTAYAEVVSKGAGEIKGAEDQPWKQRTAFFADPDGNIHEIFADL